MAKEARVLALLALGMVMAACSGVNCCSRNRETVRSPLRLDIPPPSAFAMIANNWSRALRIFSLIYRHAPSTAPFVHARVGP